MSITNDELSLRHRELDAARTLAETEKFAAQVRLLREDEHQRRLENRWFIILRFAVVFAAIISFAGIALAWVKFLYGAN